MLHWLILLCNFIIQASILQVFIVTSYKTPPLLIQTLQSLQTNNFTFYHLDYNTQTHSIIQNSNPLILIDACSQLSCSYDLSQLSSSLEIILIKVGKPEDENHRNQWKFYSSPSLHLETQSFSSLLKHFNWKSFHVLASQTQSSLKQADYFKANSGIEIFNSYINILSNTLDVEVLTDYIGRIIKPTGTWKFLIFNQEQTLIQEAFEKMKMMKKGCGVILKFQGLSSIKKGMIVVAEEGTQFSQNLYELKVQEIKLMIDLIQNIIYDLTLRNKISNYIIRNRLQNQTYKRGRVAKYVILNSQQQNILTQIGTIKGQEVHISGNLTLPGNQTSFTNDILQIRFSQNSGFINHLGQYDYQNQVYFSASQLFIDIINSDDSLLENFNIVPTHVDCGSLYFYYDHFKQCFQKLRNSLGSFFQQSSYGVVDDTLLLFRQMGIQTFQIGVYPVNHDFYDKKAYSQIVFGSSRRELLYSMLPKYLVYHNWRNIIALDTKQGDSNGFSQIFYENCQKNGVNIKNSQQTRVFKDQYATQDYEEYKHYFEEYYNSGVRVFFFMQMWNEFLPIIWSLYKIGFRQGDIQIFWVYNPSTAITILGSAFDQDTLKDLKSLLQGTLWIDFLQYTGQFEYTLKPLVQDYVAPNEITSTCYNRDILQLGVLGVDNLLTTGRDYQNKELVNDSIRMQRFNGCSGTFSIDSSSNERRDSLYYLGYTAFDPITQEILSIGVGTYSAVQNPWILIEGEFQYSNGKNTPPSDMRFRPWDCDFPQQTVQENQKSKNLQSILLCGIIGISLLISSLFLVIFRSNTPFMLSEKKNVMGWDDILLLFSIGIENVQYLILGPDFGQYSEYLSFAAQFISISLKDMSYWKKEVFWTLFHTFVGISSIWILFIIAYFISFCLKSQNIFKRFVGYIGENILPGLLNILLVPILMILFQVFECENGTSDKLQDSFMNRDCDTFCWDQKHWLYVVEGSVVIFFFVLFSLVYKLVESRFSNGKYLQISPHFNSIKGVFQVCLPVLSIILKKRFSWVFNIVFCVFISIFLVFSIKIRIYNYKRISLMHVFGVLGVLWSIILTTVFQFFTNEEVGDEVKITFTVIQLSGWIFLFVVFLIMFKKEPHIFKKANSKFGVVKLFRFMLGKTELIATRHQSQYRYQQEDKEEVSDGNIMMSSIIFPSTQILESENKYIL